MATGINFTPEGVPELNRALETLDKLTTSVGKLAGTGKSLEELRRIIVGVGASGSALGQLQNSIRELSSVVQALPEQLRTSMSGMSAAGMNAGKALGEGVEKGAKESLTKARSAVRQEINALQMQYEAAFAKGWTIKPEFLGALTKSGVSLFPSDRDRLDSVNKTQQSYNQIYAYKVTEARKAAAEEEAFSKGVERNTQASWNRIYAYKVTEARKAAAEEEAFSKGVERNTQTSWNRIYAYKVTEARKAAAEEEAFSKGVERNTQASWNRIYAYKVTEARKAAAEEEAFSKGVERNTQTSWNRIYAYKRAEAKRAADEEEALAKRTAMTAVKASINSGSGPIVSGTYSSLSNYQRVTPVVSPAVDAAKTAAATQALKQQIGALAEYTAGANTAHSAARGLASGFGLLWLTWGNMLPLLAGAGLSNGFAQIVKQGGEVEHTLAIIRVLGEESVGSIGKLQDELLALSRVGAVGPLAIAGAMKTLSLAGLQANEILSVTKDVMNFSIAGTVDINKAADTLVSVATAFGSGAESFGRIGDVISKTAAISKSSVETISEAFKTASVINAQYGVSLVDVATGLAALSQLGIQGTAAGTALRNMYADLSGRSAQVAKMLKAQGIELRDNEGKFRDLVTVVGEVRNKLISLDGLSQKNFLQSLTSERGAKALVELLRQIEQAPKTAQTAFSNMLEESRRAIQESYGFQATAAIELAQTTQSKFQGMSASLSAALVTAFGAAQPALQLFADAILKILRDDSFSSWLSTVAKFAATVTQAIAENVKIFGYALAAWVGSRIALALLAGTATLAAAATTSHTAAVAANAVATVEANAAMNATGTAAASASSGLASIGVWLSRLNVLIGVGVAAWMLYSYWKARGTQQSAADQSSIEGTLAAAKAEIERVKAQNEIMASGGSLADANRAIDNQEKFGKAIAATQTKVQEAYRNEVAAEDALSAARERASFLKGKDSENTVAARARDLASARNHRAIVEQTANAEVAKLRQVAKDIEGVYKDQAKLLEAKTPKATPLGLGKFDEHPDKPKASDVPNYTKDLLVVERAYYAQNMAELQRANAAEKQILDAKHKALLVSEGEYQAQSLAQLVRSEDAKIKEIARHEQTSLAELDAAQAKVQAAAGSVDLSATMNAEGAAYKALEADVKKLADEYRKIRQERALLTNQVSADLGKIQQEKDLREQLLAIEFQGKLAAEGKAYSDLNRELDVSLGKQRDKLALEDRLSGMSDIQRAGAQAQLAYEEQSAQAIAKRTEKLQEFTATQAALKAVLDSQAGTTVDVDPTGEITRRYDEVTAAVGRFTVVLEAMKLKASAGGETAKQIAEIAATRREVDQMAKDLSKSLADAVMKGTAGFKSLWTSLKDWLKQTFAKLVLQPMLQPIMQSIAGQVVGSSAGSIAGQTIGAAAGSSALGSAAFSGVGGVLGTGAGGMSAIAGFGTAASYGANALMAGNGLTALSGGMSMAMAGELAQGIGMIAGVAGPIVIAAMALASLDKKATPHMGGSAIADAAGNVTNIRQGNQDDAVQKSMQDVAKSSAALLNTFSAKFGGSGGFSVRAVLESDKNDGSWALYHLLKDGVKQAGSFDATPQAVGGSGTLDSDPTKAAEQFATMTAQAMRTSMETLDLPGWAKKQLDALGTEFSTSDLANAATSIYATQDAILALQKTVKPMAGSLGQLANSSSDTLFNLAQLAGGFDQLTSTLGTYYTNYYSAAEQQGAALSNLTAQYKELNMGALPTTKEAFRGVIDSFVAGGGRAQEGGEKTYITLMQLANGFAALDSNAQDLTKQTDLQISMLRAQGKESAAVAIERQREIDALSKTNPELVDMQKNLYALTDAASLKTARDDLQIQIDRALGDEAGALAIERQRELLALQNTHPELISLQQQLYNLADAATAAAAATKLYDAASSAQDKFLTDSQKINKGYHTVAQSLIKAGNTAPEETLVRTLEGLTKQEIYDLATSFITMSNASVEAKTSVAEAAGSLADLKDAAAQLAYDTTKAGMEKTIAEMTKQYGDLQAAMDLINPPLKTISQQYTDNAAALKTLSDSLDVLLGTAKKTPQEILSDMLTSQKALKDARSSVKDAILSSRLAGMTPKDKAAALREQEAGLYSQLRTAADPAAVVSKLQSVILERVKAEAAIQVATAAIVVTAAEQEASLAKVARDAQLDSLKSQLDGFKKLKDLAANMGQFIGELKFSDLSSQNYADQLNAAQSLYYTTLDKARNGDANAVANVQGNASAYLKEAQNYYGGATAPYNAIFEGVLSSLNQLGLDAQNVDPQIAALQVQIDKMSAINAALDALNTTAVDTSAAEVAALEALDTAIAARQEADAAAVAEQTQIAKEQLAVLEEQQKTLKEQILQQGKIYTDLIASLNKLNDNFEKAQKNANMEAAKP